MDAPPNAISAGSPASSPPFSDREHLFRASAPAVRRNDVSGSDAFSSPPHLPLSDVVHASVAAPNGRPSPASSSRRGSSASFVGTGGGGFAADAESLPAVSYGLVDRFHGLHVDEGNGIVPAGSSGGGCTYAKEEVVGAGGRSVGPLLAQLEDRRLAANLLLDGYDRVYGAVEEEPNRAALRRSAFEEYVLLSTNAQRQRAALMERRLAPQWPTDGPAVPYADGLSGYGHSGLHNEHRTSFGNACCRGTRENNGMISHIDFLQWQQRRIDLGHHLGLLSAQTSMQAMPSDLHCGLPVSNEQDGIYCDWEHQSLPSARNIRNTEPLRENTLNYAHTIPHALRYGLPAYNQQNNRQCDWGLQFLASARNMRNPDPYGCGLPVPSGQWNFEFDRETEFLASTRSMRNSEVFCCDDSLIMNGKPMWFPACSRQIHQREEKRSPRHDNRVHNRAGHNSDIGQLHTPDNHSLSMIHNNVNIHKLAKEQHGCLSLQQMLDKGNPELLDDIYNGVIHHVVDLMMDPSGNFLMQKLLDTCDEDQRLGIILIITEKPVQLVNISLNPHGTRVVQKLIETLKTQQQIEFVVSALEPGFLELINDINGNHVIQQCLVTLPSEHKKFIFDGASKHCVNIATQRHGCCVLQRCIEFATGEYQENLVAQVSANAYLLAIDAFGNYVVQYVLNLQRPLAIADMLSQFQGNYVTLSTQKFSSNVVEKCLKVFHAEDRARIVYELLSFPRFEQLLQDPYANYVIKTALESTKGSTHDALVEAIRPHEPALRTSPHCRQIFSMIKK